MIVDPYIYHLLLKLDLLIKIRAIVDVEKGMIQVRQGPRTTYIYNMLNMVNMLQVVKEKVQPKSNVDQENAMKMDVSL